MTRHGALTLTHFLTPARSNNARRLLYAFGVTAGFMLVESLVVFFPVLWHCWPMRVICDRYCRPAFRPTRSAIFPSSSTIRHTFGWLRLTTLAAFVNASPWW